MSQARLFPVDLLEFARSVRKDSASSEAKLWKCLRNRQLGGFKFRRQHPVASFIVDFYCAQADLIIEIDGDSHAERGEYDARRTKRFVRDGISVIRFVNDDVQLNLDAVLEEIVCECESRSFTKSPSP